MASKPVHLVERAAERLLQSGLLDASRSPGAARPEDIEAGPRGAGAGDAGFRDQGPAPGPAPGIDPGLGRSADQDRNLPARPIVDQDTLVKAGLMDWSQARSRIAEEFRLVQGQVLRAEPAEGESQAPMNLILVTSAKPGEGKSFTALNLAASIARQRDREVLLVDVDSKPDSLGAQLGLREARGLLDLLTVPGLQADDLVVATSLDRLGVLPIGANAEQSAELFATRQMATLIQDMARRHPNRIIILDAPPCLSSSDPSTFAPLVGQTVLVVQAETTQRPEVEAALDLIQTCPTIMLLLNKVQLMSKHAFGAYTKAYS